MATETVSQTFSDEVQIFDVAEAVKKRDHLSGRVDMAKSPNSFVAVFQTKPRGGEAHIHQHPDSDQILFLLKGELTLESLSGKYTLKPDQGVMIPAGVHYGFINTTDQDAVFLSMRTESSGGRRVAHVANVSSDVRVRVPASAITSRGLGRHIYVYALDRTSFGISAVLLEEWNKASLLRMHCDYAREGDSVVATLPLRIVQWYRLETLKEGDYDLTPENDGTRVRVDLQPMIERQAGRK
ncbi:MAG TPA: cupin domain-containing protein [Candidatus Binatia bacterium]